MYVLFFSGYPLAMPAAAELSRSVRSAGGNHTLTRARQKVRVVPHGSVYTPEPSSRIRSACLWSVCLFYCSKYYWYSSFFFTCCSPSVHDELDIIGQDGHIYKGRLAKDRLPRIGNSRRDFGRASHPSRPSTSPHQQPVAY